MGNESHPAQRSYMREMEERILLEQRAKIDLLEHS